MLLVGDAIDVMKRLKKGMKYNQNIDIASSSIFCKIIGGEIRMQPLFLWSLCFFCCFVVVVFVLLLLYSIFFAEFVLGFFLLLFTYMIN